jgi:uncharacterized DUF497 family protein
MDFDWNSPTTQCVPPITPMEVEESFEDPFAVKLMPDTPRFSVQARFFNLGKAASGAGVFAVYKTNGRQVRVICARPFEPEDAFFYQRRANQALAQ